MTSLTEFLLARLVEDEALAKAATGEHWQVVDEGCLSDNHQPIKRWSVQTDATEHHRDPAGGWWHLDAVSVDEDRDYNFPQGGCRRQEDARHIARHDPARVLAQVKALRAVIEWHQNWPVLAEREPEFDPPMQGGIRAGRVEDMTFRMTKQIAWLTEQEYRARFGDEPPTSPILLMLAQPYRDHPDFDPSWLTM